MRGEGGMRVFGGLLGGVVSAGAMAALLTTGAAWSADVTFDCPATDGKDKVELHFAGETLDVTDAAGTAALPASLEGDVASMFGVSGFGEAEQMVAEPAAMDACLAGELKGMGSPAEDESAVGYALAGCQSKLAGGAVKQAVDLHVTATVIDKGSAMVFIQRTYRTPSSVTGEALTLDEFPTRNCTVVAN